MTEHDYARGLLYRLRRDFPDAVIFKHADSFTSGVPDISFTWGGRTTWLELKHANPRILDTGVQALYLKRMAKAGSAWYVIYGKHGTKIVKPEHLNEWDVRYYMSSPKVDHKMVADFVRELHSS